MASCRLYEFSKQTADQFSIHSIIILSASTVVNPEPANTLATPTITLAILPSALSSQVIMTNNNYNYYSSYNLNNTKRQTLELHT